MYLPPASFGLHSFLPPWSGIHRWSRGLRRCRSRSTKPVIGISWLATASASAMSHDSYVINASDTFFLSAIAMNARRNFEKRKASFTGTSTKNGRMNVFGLRKKKTMSLTTIIFNMNKPTFMFLCMSPLQREMSGTVKGFHAGSNVFLMT